MEPAEITSFASYEDVARVPYIKLCFLEIAMYINESVKIKYRYITLY